MMIFSTGPQRLPAINNCFKYKRKQLIWFDADVLHCDRIAG